MTEFGMFLLVSFFCIIFLLLLSVFTCLIASKKDRIDKNFKSLTKSQKQIFDLYSELPFLIPRDFDGNKIEDLEYNSLGLEIPDGWQKLFIQMCRDIKPLLIQEGLLDEFYFYQVKEKYNTLRCYCHSLPVSVAQVISKYEHMSRYICSVCGRPAARETTDYILSFCDDCWKDFARQEPSSMIKFKSYFVINSSTEGTHCDEKKISFKDEWDRYLKENHYDSI